VEQSGCHPKEDVISILTGNVKSVYGENFSNLSIITLAPELEGAEEAIANLTKLGVKGESHKPLL
jgi:N-acetylglucosamine-6-phosphate deacetylase